MREAAMCRGPSAGSLTGSGSSSDTLTASASALSSSSAPDLLSKARNSRWAPLLVDRSRGMLIS